MTIWWIKARPGLTLGGILGLLESNAVEKCDVHLSERGPTMALRPPFSEPNPFTALYLDRTCSKVGFGYGSEPGSPFTAHVMLAPSSPAASDVPID